MVHVEYAAVPGPVGTLIARMRACTEVALNGSTRAEHRRLLLLPFARGNHSCDGRLIADAKEEAGSEVFFSSLGLGPLDDFKKVFPLDRGQQVSFRSGLRVFLADRGPHQELFLESP